jgi:hypothetical protein
MHFQTASLPCYRISALPKKSFSFTPGFSPVLDSKHYQKTVSTVFGVFTIETVKNGSHN